MWVDQFYLSNVCSATIESITISDHSHITMTICPSIAGHREQIWRMNEALLDNREIFLQSLATYFGEIDTGEVSIQVVWEAHKAVIRGKLIAHGSRIKKRLNTY